MTFGLGLRSKHYEYIFQNRPNVDWFEIISENFMDSFGRPRTNLSKIKELYPLVLHGVSLSIGTVDPLNSEYLKKLKNLIKFVKPKWISDHLCWSGVAHKNTHDLLPIPYTEESLKHLVKRIKQVQDFLEMPIALENPSTYLEFNHSTFLEAEFIAEMAKQSGCNLLVDINNIFVTCFNHDLDPKHYIDSLPLDSVIQVHLSGHTRKETHIIDTHDDFVADEVWSLYKYFINRLGRTPNTMIEWDDNIPEFPVLFNELEKAKIAAADAKNFSLNFSPPKIEISQQIKAQQIYSLAETQNIFQEIVFDEERAIPQNFIAQKSDFSELGRVGIYREAYRLRLFDCTVEDYPVLKKYLGEESFENLMWQFVESERPNHFNIARFPLKLQNFIEEKLPDDKFAHEICALETAVTQLADEIQDLPMTAEDFAGISEDKFSQMKLKIRSAAQFFEFKNSVNQFYQKVMNGEEAQIIEEESFLMVFASNDKVWRIDLEKDEFEILQKIRGGESIENALSDFDPTKSEKITSWFSRWISNGLIAK